MISHSSFFVFFISFLGTLSWQISVAQPPITDAHIQSALIQLQKKATDSIEVYHNESARLRSEMETQLTELGYDRTFIFGENDKFFKAGMHRHFSSTPVEMSLQIDRNPLHIAFENNHILLFHADKSYFQWLHAHRTLHKERTEPLFKKLKNEKIIRNAQKLSPFFQQQLSDATVRQQWIAKEISCQLLSNKKGKVDDFKKAESLARSTKIPHTSIILPPDCDYISPENIFAAYPFDGQYNFYLREFKREVGYVFFHQFPPKLQKNQEVIKAKWTNTKGQSILTDTRLDYYKQSINYPIPVDFLQKNQLYQLQLIRFAQKAETFVVEDDFCISDETFFRNLNISDPANNQLGTVLYTAHFRTSKYDSYFQKNKELVESNEWSNFKTEVTLDEPYDEFEWNGNGTLPPSLYFEDVIFLWAAKVSKLYDQHLIYFLKVPEITPVDTVDLATPILAELDHTINAPFIANVRLANVNAYTKAANRKDSLKVNNYIIPPSPKDNISFKQSSMPPRITAEMFAQKQLPSLLNTQLTIDFLGAKNIGEQVQFMSKQIQERIQERANFFFLLDARQRRRSGTTDFRPYAYFLQKEQENLPKAVQEILQYKEDDYVKFPVTIEAVYTLPGTDKVTTRGRIIISDSEK